MVSSQQSENGVKHEENQRNRHVPLRVDSIAHLDAESFLASTKSREKKSVELEVDGPLLSPNAEKADQQFFESYNLLLSDTNYDMQMELEGGEETKWMIDESKRTSEAFKRMPVSGNHKSVRKIPALEHLPVIYGLFLIQNDHTERISFRTC